MRKRLTGPLVYFSSPHLSLSLSLLLSLPPFFLSLSFSSSTSLIILIISDLSPRGSVLRFTTLVSISVCFPAGDDKTCFVLMLEDPMLCCFEQPRRVCLSPCPARVNQRKLLQTHPSLTAVFSHHPTDNTR
jgi:hypothetical protein